MLFTFTGIDTDWTIDLLPSVQINSSQVMIDDPNKTSSDKSDVHSFSFNKYIINQIMPRDLPFSGKCVLYRPAGLRAKCKLTLLPYRSRSGTGTAIY